MKRIQKRIEGDAFKETHETVIMAKDGKAVSVEVTGLRSIWGGQIVSVAIT